MSWHGWCVLGGFAVLVIVIPAAVELSWFIK